MIKINLLGDETAVNTSGRLWLMGYGACLALYLVICGLLYYSTHAQVLELRSEEQARQEELDDLKKTTKEVRDLENKKKELQAKRAVIARLKLNKVGPVRVMDDLNMAIPEKAWLTTVKENGGAMRITGFALDNPTVAAFIQALQKSPYFDPEISLVESKQATREGVRIMQFVLETKIRYAGRFENVVSSKEEKKAKG
jgi:type IV pilus assembly protein PilN